MFQLAIALRSGAPHTQPNAGTNEVQVCARDEDSEAATVRRKGSENSFVSVFAKFKQKHKMKTNARTRCEGTDRMNLLHTLLAGRMSCANLLVNKYDKFVLANASVSLGHSFSFISLRCICNHTSKRWRPNSILDAPRGVWVCVCGTKCRETS